MSDTQRPLNPNHLRFIDELLGQPTLNASQAYQRVFPNASHLTAGVNAGKYMADPRVAAEIARRQAITREKFAMEADDVFREIFLIATADPRDLIEYYRGACRHCYGDDYRYQRTPAEYQTDFDEYRNGKRGKEDPEGIRFPYLGGIGFNPRKPPLAACPECHGDGVGYELVKDTRTLSKGAARLYAGVKKTKDGLEIKMRSQDKAVEMAGRCLGLFKDKVEVAGKDGGPIATVSMVTSDPIEAAAIYQKMIAG